MNRVSRVRSALISLFICFSFFHFNAFSEVDHYGSLPAVSEVEISPDGETLAMLQTIDDMPVVMFLDVKDKNKKPVAAALNGAKARGIAWVNNKYILALVSVSDRVHTTVGFEPIEFYRWVAIRLRDLKATPLFKNGVNRYIGEAGTMVSTLPNEPNKALFIRQGRIRKADLDTGEIETLDVGNDDTAKWIFDCQGDIDLRIDTNDDQMKIYKNVDDEFTFAAEHKKNESGNWPFWIFGRSAIQNQYFAWITTEDDRDVVAVYDIDTQALLETQFSVDKYDIDSAVNNVRNATITGFNYTDHFPQLLHVDANANALQNAFKQALGTESVSFVSTSDDNNIIIAQARYNDHPEHFFMYQRDINKLELIAQSYPPLDGNSIAEKVYFEHTASDEVTIPGYITYPRKDKKNLPLIVLPHGGPEARVDQSFDWWSFFYASKGYAVYQPNFRGSSGYGEAFVDKGKSEWGRKMRTDVDEGVTALVNAGIVDPQRVWIVGASYGGYAALISAALSKDMY